jgi:hypothetical protein
MEWTQDNTLGFIELYEKMSVLWDPNHPKYYNKLHKHLPTRSSEQLVDHSTQPVRRNARRFVRTNTSGRTEPRAVTLRQIAQVWTRPKRDKITGENCILNMIVICTLTKYCYCSLN